MIKTVIRFARKAAYAARLEPVLRRSAILKRIAWQLYDCSSQSLETIQLSGFSLRCMKDRHLSYSLSTLGAYEPFQTKLFVDRVHRNVRVLDIGANVGYYSMLAAARGATVTAFEPHPGNFALLQENAAANGFNLSLHNVALSDRCGTATLWLDDHNPGGHSLAGSPAQDQKTAISVRVARLDDFNIAADVIKIDVEGYEMRVLSGGERTFASASAIFCEFNPSALRLAGIAPVEFLNYLRKSGLKISVEHEDKQALLEMDVAEIERMADEIGNVNLFCVRADSPA